MKGKKNHGLFVHPDTDKVQIKPESPLSLTLDLLSAKVSGKGRAQLSWDCLRLGVDPLLYYNPNYPEDQLDNALETKISKRVEIQQEFPVKRRSQTMGNKALRALSQIYPSPLGIESSIATISSVTTSSDNTTKILLKLSNTDHYIETVIIPHPEWNKSTLCISSQVGCAQGCVFCATGKMGRLDSLSTDQILIQLYYANKICRTDKYDVLPQIDNVSACRVNKFD